MVGTSGLGEHQHSVWPKPGHLHLYHVGFTAFLTDVTDSYMDTVPGAQRDLRDTCASVLGQRLQDAWVPPATAPRSMTCGCGGSFGQQAGTGTSSCSQLWQRCIPPFRGLGFLTLDHWVGRVHILSPQMKTLRCLLEARAALSLKPYKCKHSVHQDS